MRFYIQSSSPRSRCVADQDDETLAEAIESMFLLNTENAILIWDHISIPLSYKYDISYMMEDILILLNKLQDRTNGELTIHWLPDTFRCDQTFRWGSESLHIHSHWENTVGHLETLLNECPDLSLDKMDFIREWKSILGTVIAGLKKCGYEEKKIKGMDLLLKLYKSIKGDGILYRE